MRADRLVLTDDSEPLVRIVRLDRVEPVGVEPFEKFAVVAHQPDYEFAARFYRSVDGGVLHIGRFAIFTRKDKIDLGVLFRPRINLTGTSGKFVTLWRRIGKLQFASGTGKVNATAQEENREQAFLVSFFSFGFSIRYCDPGPGFSSRYLFIASQLSRG